MIAAKRFIKDFNVPHDIPFLVDDMSNDFNNKYASWPFRFWVLKKDGLLRPRVQFKAMPRLAARSWNSRSSIANGLSKSLEPIQLRTK